MKKITVYEAKDGKRFDTKADCEYYESIISNVERIMSRLNGNEGVCSTVAIRQDVDEVKEALHDFMVVCAEVIPSFRDWFMEVGNGSRHISHAWRILSDYRDNFPILYKAYYRFYCIDLVIGVEYERPYFAIHPEEFRGKIK